MKGAYVFVLCSLLILWAAPVQAEAGFEIKPGMGYLTGYTKMQFGGLPEEYLQSIDPRAPYFPMAEHKFPLMSGIATIDAKVTVGPLTIEGSVKQNLTHDTGMERTYDWGEFYYNPDPDEDGEDPGWYYNVNYYEGTDIEWYDVDVETESRTRMEAKMWNAKASLQVYTYGYDYYYTDWFTGNVKHKKGDISVSLGLGYEKRTFDFETRLKRQWSPSGFNDEYSMTGDGSVTETYTVDYSIPFAEIGVAHRTEKSYFDISFGASNLVHVSDDEFSQIQIPGPLYGDGHLSGNALKFVSHLQYNITPNLFVGLAADYIYINADGKMNQHADPYLIVHQGDGGPYGFILNGYDMALEEKVKSQQSCFTFNVGFRFGT